MNFYIVASFFCILSSVSSQYHAQYRSQELLQPQVEQGEQVSAQESARQLPAPLPYSNIPTTATPAILLHKQSLTHDGGFNFAFSADNGLQHGESIQPDGTRSGGYSYVDPNGKTISVRYTAGKDGFKILPSSSDAVAPQQLQQPQQLSQQVPLNQPQVLQQPLIQQQQRYPLQPQIQYAGPQTFRNEPNVDGAQFRDTYRKPQNYGFSLPLPRYLLYKNGAANANAIQSEQEYFDEPGKPHSFGTGYSFEFSG